MKFQHKVAIGAGVVGVSALGWYVWRSQQRARLTEMLTASPAVQRVAGAGLIPWTPAQKAAELIGPTTFVSAETAMAQVLSSLPEVPEQRVLPGYLPEEAQPYAQQAATYASQAKAYLQSWFGEPI